MEIVDTAQLVKFFLSLVFVVSLMGGLALVMRRFGQGKHAIAPRKRRLKIVEILPIDSRRRLAIIRRDDKEHLVILGSNSETIIETGIESPQDDVIKSNENDDKA